MTDKPLTINGATNTSRTGVLIIGAATLYSAWWTTNATHKTTQTKPPHFDESWRP